MRRRTFIKASSATALSIAASPMIFNASATSTSKIHQLTTGERQHWFGYYDKWQVDPTGRYVLGMEVDVFFRSPTPNDIVKIGYIDLRNDNKWTGIGQSSAWGWQQGCMLQWIPGSTEEVIWNARLEDQFVSIVHNIKTGRQRILPKPVYTLSPDGAFGLGVDFARLQFYRPGYGYASSEPRDFRTKAPADAGIYRMDLKTGASKLIISYENVSKIDRSLGSVADNYHWINHLLINPDGSRFIFLNRSRPYATAAEYREAMGDKINSNWITRAITADTDGSDLFALNDSGHFSHFIWKGSDAICAWANPEDNDKAAFYVFQDRSKKYHIVGEDKMTVNGHNTYVPNTNYEWILNDTYPQGKERLQELYLYHVPTDKKVVLGKFHEPEKFTGEWRCDLHPRCNQQGTKVFFDSTHNGGKRQIYMVSIEDIIKNA